MNIYQIRFFGLSTAESGYPKKTRLDHRGQVNAAQRWERVMPFPEVVETHQPEEHACRYDSGNHGRRYRLLPKGVAFAIIAGVTKLNPEQAHILIVGIGINFIAGRLRDLANERETAPDRPEAVPVFHEGRCPGNPGAKRVFRPAWRGQYSCPTSSLSGNSYLPGWTPGNAALAMPESSMNARRCLAWKGNVCDVEDISLLDK